MPNETEKKIKLCIIDSGVDHNHKLIESSTLSSSVTVNKNSENNIYITKDARDKIGHGTAINSIINRYNKDVEVHNIKIFDEELECDNEKFLYALQYIEENIECDVLNLSLGFTSIENVKEIREILYRLYKKGTIIVSAFDNGGAVSYPAAFDFVIGVDNNENCLKYNEFVYYESNMVNIGAFGSIQRVAWKDSTLMMVVGASYANAYVTAQVINFLKQGIYGLENILNEFKKISKYSYTINKSEINDKVENKNIKFKIEKAIVFPINKEINSIINFSDMLDFELCGIYDHRRMGKIGKKITSLYNTDISYVVKNFDDIDWNANFDTLILGHTFEVSKVLNEDVAEKVINLCIKHNKNIYSFDDLKHYKNLYEGKIKVTWPKKDKSDISEYTFDKLYYINTPVLGVFGTSSKQGKYTLQLLLRKMFQDDGYNVGQVGTEPSAELFGMDEVFPMGYNGTVELEGNDFIRCLNNIMNKIDCKEKDIILVGCQSGTVPYSYSNIAYLSLPQINFLIGTMPDAVILAINPFDEIDYIERSIKFIESAIRCKVIATVMFPMDFKNNWAQIMNARVAIERDEINQVIEKITNKFDIPCYILGEEEDMKQLYSNCINYFS